jgi:hypothetical protein
MNEDERQRHRRARHGFTPGDLVEAAEQRCQALAPWFATRVLDAEAEEAARQRTPGERRDLTADALVEDAVAQRRQLPATELGLVRGDRKRHGRLQRIELRRGVVRHPHLAYLAVAPQALEGGGDLLRMREKVGAVDLVEVDHLAAQAAERLLARAQDVGAARVVGHAGDDAALGGDEHLRAQSGRLGEHAPEEILGRAGAAVDVGMIEEIDTHLQRRLDLRARRAHVGAGEAPAAVGQGKRPQRRPPEPPRRGRDLDSTHDGRHSRIPKERPSPARGPGNPAHSVLNRPA